MAKIRFHTRIAHATDNEESARYALQGTLVTPDGFAVATDGHIAACVKVKVDGLDSPAMIPQELGPTSKTDLKAEYHTNDELKCEKHSIVKGQRRVEQADVRVGRFPRVGDILNGMDTSEHLVLAINANYLWRLAQAINPPDSQSADVVVLLIPTPEKDGVVTEVLGVLSNDDSRHGEDAGGFGIIMPCDALAAQTHADFNKLRKAAAASLDAAAKSWSDQSIKRGQKEVDTDLAAETSGQLTTHIERPARSKPRRKAGRKRSVA